ncbi:HNH endonuclease [Arthrobacter sp. 24S4-2]|uniref:HNH endonuclease n=1 Tax=Arthrobacter sp. 24S4-2 TaxID=2575374 RepID=UPI0010C7D8E6|nr:HNH endonuclease [Arthrobacter sp. 24S4-2]
MASSNWSGRKVTGARATLAHQLPLPCYRCGITIPSAAECKAQGISWDVDHIQAQAHDGSHNLSNLTVSHSACNRRHGGKLGNARKAQAKAVRAVESERTHKFWNVAALKSFFDAGLRTLVPAPSFFVSALPHGGN